jgi:hypothetical protein
MLLGYRGFPRGYLVALDASKLMLVGMLCNKYRSKRRQRQQNAQTEYDNVQP